MLYVIGAGGHGKVVKEAARLQGWEVSFIDSKATQGSTLAEEDFLANHTEFQAKEWALICGVGSVGAMGLRQHILDRYQPWLARFQTIIHPNAVVGREVKLGRGAFVAQGSQIVSGKVAEHAIINTGSILDHDVEIGFGSHIGPGSVLSGDVRCGKWVHVGTGSIIIQGCKIADEVVLGAGTVVIRDILEPGSTWVGSPARRIR